MSNSTSTSNKTGNILDERRIWIGNLDTRLSEYQLLKIMQKCGQIEKFDMLFHKSGPMVGQSRGYAFVTFSSSEGAVNALHKLNGTLVANRPIAVRLAKNVNYDDLDRPKPRIEIPALGTGRREGKFSKEEAIRAIEAKLKVLERHADDDLQLDMATDIRGRVPPVPFIQRYQFNKDRDASGNSSSSNQRSSSYNSRNYSRGSSSAAPYNRSQRPKRR